MTWQFCVGLGLLAYGEPLKIYVQMQRLQSMPRTILSSYDHDQTRLDGGYQP